ncbi:RING-H2 finger protein ATL66-like [Lycium ferocissimum]|uniref:RING-H2 finger protein ATL66-like n=1 Tax=Lycium ferocissimum TaxID=112874 RepID=UPI0028157983|nr:RING-H2 finger protein ATL66-like [Lycium ferocissimum]
MGNTWQCSTKSSQIILHLSDIMLYERLDLAIWDVLVHWKEEFEDQHDAIIERTARRLRRIIRKESNECRQMLGVSVDVTLVIHHVCDGRILLALEESSADGMVPASKSSMKLLNKIEVDENNINDDCIVCLEEIGKESEVLCTPCSHIFHGECITKWLEKSHYCPLCRFEMPTDSTRLQKEAAL